MKYNLFIRISRRVFIMYYTFTRSLWPPNIQGQLHYESLIQNNANECNIRLYSNTGSTCIYIRWEHCECIFFVNFIFYFFIYDVLLLYINESFCYKVENVVFNNFMSGVLCLTLSLLNYCISGEFNMYLVTTKRQFWKRFIFRLYVILCLYYSDFKFIK